MRGVRQTSEQDLHRTVADFLNVALPADVWWTTIPAGGGGKIRGAILKGMGYRAGTPDILVISGGIARFIELKTTQGRVSEAQARCHAEIMKAGSAVAVCRSLDDVTRTLLGWGIEIRARAA